MSKDPDMRSHVILSMIKVAAAEADVPPMQSSATSSRLQQFLFKGSCSSIHMAGSCCNWTNFLVVFNFLIILLRSNCQVIVALWRCRTAHPRLLPCYDFLCYYYNYYYNSLQSLFLSLLSSSSLLLPFKFQENNKILFGCSKTLQYFKSNVAIVIWRSHYYYCKSDVTDAVATNTK